MLRVFHGFSRGTSDDPPIMGSGLTTLSQDLPGAVELRVWLMFFPLGQERVEEALTLTVV